MSLDIFTDWRDAFANLCNLWEAALWHDQRFMFSYAVALAGRDCAIHRYRHCLLAGELGAMGEDLEDVECAA